MSILTPDMGYFDNALRIVNIALHGRINHTAQTSLANDILCVAAGLRSAALIEQLYLNPNDIERIQSMFHHTTRFSHLDLLSIGSDHIFIIHRQLLLQDIHEYLSDSEHGLHRVFINVDYLLSQPEILPGRRYEPLDKYLREHLLPDLEMRIQCWDQAELCYLPLPVPDHIDDGDTTITTATVDTTTTTTTTTSSELTPYTEITATENDPTRLGLSMVTLSGWLLGYPVNYVLPTTAKMMARKRAARALKQRERALIRQQKLATKLLRHQKNQQLLLQQGMSENQVLSEATDSRDSTDCSTYADDGNMSDDEGECDTAHGQSFLPDEEEDEDEEEEDSSHNSLANRLLVLTQVNLTANEVIHGLKDYCLFSFSYPSAILNGHPVAITGVEIPSPGDQLPTAPTSPLWLSGKSNPSADQEMNPFETSLLNNNNNNGPRSYPTTIPGALPPTPTSPLAPIMPSNCPTATTTKPPLPIAVGPSIVSPPKPMHLASPPLQHHRLQGQRRRLSRSIHPFDTAPDSSDDPSFPSSFYTHRHNSSTVAARDQNRSQSPSPTPFPSCSNIEQHRFHRSEEPPYHHHHHHHHHYYYHSHDTEGVERRGLSSKERNGDKEENHEPLPQGHPEICAAGRSMLQVLHSRFLRQGVWKTWQVGQQTVTLPVVAL